MTALQPQPFLKDETAATAIDHHPIVANMFVSIAAAVQDLGPELSSIFHRNRNALN